ncbi:MAG: helix-turn-helix domain-containing protein [Bacteroidota bacterium]|nr:helix-turn-helix domain-containing protein [Bacteroidota bacterium]
MLFYTVQLITFRKKENPSQLPLGMIMLFMSVYLLLNLVEYLGHLPPFENFVYLFTTPVVLAIIPTYFVYFKKLIGKPVPALENSLLAYYFSPLFILSLNIILYLSLSKHEINTFLHTPLLEYELHSFSSALLFVVSILANVILIGRQVILSGIWFRRLIKDNSKIILGSPFFNLRWNRMLLVSLNLFIVICSLQNILHQEIYHFSTILLNSAFILSGGMAGYFALKQHNYNKEKRNLRANKPLPNMEKIRLSEKQNNERHNNYTIVPETEAEQIMVELKEMLSTKKPFLKSDLRLTDLAREIGVDNLKLTYVLNYKINTNFYSLINKYRVQEAKRLLSNPENNRYTIETIFHMAGFRSKASFNNYFREETGFTPSQYRNNLLK